MPYTPNPADATQPTEDKSVESAAAEFRALKADVIRSLKFPSGESSSYQGPLPAAASRAGRFLAFDSVTGQPITGPAIADWTITSAQIADISVVAANIVDVQNAEENAAAAIAARDEAQLIVDEATALATPADNTVSTAKIQNLAVTPGKLAQKLTSGTAVATTSGTAIDFTSIPSWVKRITVMLNGVSTNGANPILVQVGSGSVQATGYNSVGAGYNTTIGTTGSTAGFLIRTLAASSTVVGIMTIALVSGNTWVASFVGQVSTTDGATSSGNVTLSGTLDRLRITTVNGTDTFDAGSVNILYEG